MGNIDLEGEIEKKINHVLRGVSEALEAYIRDKGLSIEDTKAILEKLEPSFKLLTKKWTLTIIYTLLLTGPLSFNKLHELTKVNKRSLSQRLKELEKNGLVRRQVRTQPPVTTVYFLTKTGRDTGLLIIPLIYYVARASYEGGVDRASG